MNLADAKSALGVSIPTGLRALYTRNGHPFSRGSVVKGNTVNTLALAQANTSANAAVTGVVDQVTAETYTKFLLHCDGSANSTTFVEETGRAMTANGNAKISSDAKWGTGAALFVGGSSDAITTPATADLLAGTGDLAFDCWFKPEATTTDGAFLTTGFGTGLTFAYYPFSGNTNSRIFFYVGGSNVYFTIGSIISEGSWHHIAVSRTSGTVRAYLDGTQIDTDKTLSDNNNAQGTLLQISASGYDPSLNGKLDEIRLSIGTNRGWTGSTISVPTGAYSAYGDDFGVCFCGLSQAGFSDLTAGEYYLDQTTPGLLTSTRPGSGIVRHVASVSANGTPPMIQIYGEVP